MLDFDLSARRAPLTRLITANLVSPTLIGMSAPALPPEGAGSGRFLTILEIPPGPPGVRIAQEAITGIVGGEDQSFALVTDRTTATELLRPDLPLEDPRTALVVMTSGSTGDPKGVCWSRENLLATSSMWHQRYPDLADAPRVVALPVTTAGGLGVIVRATVDRAPIVAVDSIGGATRFTSQVFADAVAPIADAGPVVSLVPTQVALLIRDELGRQALQSMRRVFLGGAAAPARLISEARELGIDIVTTYGMTETCGGCVHDAIPLDGVGVRVDGGGRIHLTGAMCALGYRLRPIESAESFTHDTFTTGDVGAWDGHRLSVLGRVDDIVQVRGVNVAIGAVEQAITDSGLGRETVVIALEDEVDGHRLHALVIPEQSGAVHATNGPVDPTWTDAIEQAVRARLGAIAVPRTIRPVSVLPYLPGGKIDRRASRVMLEATIDSTDHPTTAEGT